MYLMPTSKADRLAFPTRQGLRNLAMFPKWDRQEDDVGLERFLQRFGNNLSSNLTSLRFQFLGQAAACDRHVDIFTREGVGQGLAYLAESNNCVAHNFLQYLLVLLSRRSNPVSAFETTPSPGPADLKRPSCRHPRTTPHRSRNWSRLKQGTAQPSQSPQAAPSCPAESATRRTPAPPWSELPPASVR